ncbi:hypothetical protein VKT23_018403 [Stygiomarasmius scandens]|uniref:Mid2 domain-containing protein n=1 Tax=Marasmiellus scandens TaxID=2682957 RepID=A0ABR1ISJ4_9AGAR
MQIISFTMVNILHLYSLSLLSTHVFGQDFDSMPFMGPNDPGGKFMSGLFGPGDSPDVETETTVSTSSASFRSKDIVSTSTSSIHIPETTQSSESGGNTSSQTPASIAPTFEPSISNIEGDNAVAHPSSSVINSQTTPQTISVSTTSDASLVIVESSTFIPVPPTPSPTPAEGTGSKNIGPIIGGVLGGCGILIVTIICLTAIRRRRRQNKSDSDANKPTPYVYQSESVDWRRSASEATQIHEEKASMAEFTASDFEYPNFPPESDFQTRSFSEPSHLTFNEGNASRAESTTITESSARQPENTEVDDLLSKVRALERTAVFSQGGTRDLQRAIATILEQVRRSEGHLDSELEWVLADDPPPQYVGSDS